MHRNLFTLVLVIGIIAVLVACGGEPTTSTSDSASDEASAGESTTATGTIVLGDIDSQPTDQIETWQPVADYLASNLEEFNIGAGAVRIAPDLETMGEWLESGEVDLTFESVYPAMIQINQFGSEPILRQWKGGDAEYASLIFAGADSELSAIADMEGHTIAFEQASSTTAYFLPMTALIEAGLTPVELDEPGDPVGDGEVGYLFSGSDANTIQWVISGRVDAGATSNQDFRDIPEETRDQLTVVHETRMVPRQLVLARSGLPEPLKERIIELLIDLESTEEGQEIMQGFEETARFDALPDNVEAELARIQDLYERTLASDE